MAQLVVSTALAQCSFGGPPSSVMVIVPTVTGVKQPAANIQDFAPMVNIMPFGMCTTPTNPMVASATAAALGVLTPMPCIPATSAPWMPGSTSVMVRGMPALNSTSKCMCTYGGVISVSFPGQVTDNVA